MNRPFILLFMVFMHIVDDYYLQGVLASMKQKACWEKNAPEPLYKNDYKIALGIHAMSWAFCIMFPIAIADGFNIDGLFVLFWVLNSMLHYDIDDAKANKHRISLRTDQLLHGVQIIATFVALVLIR